jgi:hypothetical protein
LNTPADNFDSYSLESEKYTPEHTPVMAQSFDRNIKPPSSQPPNNFSFKHSDEDEYSDIDDPPAIPTKESNDNIKNSFTGDKFKNITKKKEYSDEYDDASVKSMSDASHASNDRLQKRLIELLGDNKGGTEAQKSDRSSNGEFNQFNKDFNTFNNGGRNRYDNSRGGGDRYGDSGGDRFIGAGGDRYGDAKGYDIPEKGRKSVDDKLPDRKERYDNKSERYDDKTERRDNKPEKYDDKSERRDKRYERKDNKSRNNNYDYEDHETDDEKDDDKFKNPPTLKELDNKINMKNKVEDAQDLDDKKRHLIHKFKSLKKSYPDETIQDYTIYSDYTVMKEDYDETLKKLSMDSTVESYKKYLTYGFMGVEYVFGNFFGLDMKGFTQQQLISMKSYDKLLIELGEKNYEPVGASKWPVEVRLIFLIIINSAFFIGSKIIMSRSGTNFIDIMNNFSSFATAPEKTTKKKMKEPPIDFDD